MIHILGSKKRTSSTNQKCIVDGFRHPSTNNSPFFMDVGEEYKNIKSPYQIIQVVMRRFDSPSKFQPTIFFDHLDL